MLTITELKKMPSSNMRRITVTNQTDKPITTGQSLVQSGETRVFWRHKDKIQTPEAGKTVTGYAFEAEGYNLTQTTIAFDKVMIDGIAYNRLAENARDTSD